MNKELIVPYTKRKITADGQSPSRIIYSPFLSTFLSHKDDHLGFLFPSVIDSGADRCIFPLNFGERIKLDMKKGEPRISRGLGDSDIIYFHKVTVRVVILGESWQFDCEAGFSASLNDMGIGFLGRKGFFELFEEVAFNEKRREFRLKLHNGE